MIGGVTTCQEQKIWASFSQVWMEVKKNYNIKNTNQSPSCSWEALNHPYQYVPLSVTIIWFFDINYSWNHLDYIKLTMVISCIYHLPLTIETMIIITQLLASSSVYVSLNPFVVP